MPIYKNLDRLKQWLDETMKGYHDFEACLEDLEQNRRETGVIGLNDYELRGLETKSGEPELFRYEYEVEFDEDGDILSETFIF